MWLRLVVIAMLFCCCIVTRAGAADCHVERQPCNASELWVRDQVDSGLEADLDQFCRQNDPACAPIRPAFLRALITRSLSDQPDHPRAVRLRNAFICEALGSATSCDERDFRSNLRGYLGSIRDQTEFKPLDLRDLPIGDGIALVGSTFRGDVLLGGARTAQVLDLDETTIFGNVDAHRLYAVAGVTMFSSLIAGGFEADDFRSDGTVNLFRSWILGKIHLRGARIGHDLDLGEVWIVDRASDSSDGVTFNQRNSVGSPRRWLDLSNAEIGGHLLMTGIRVPRQGADLSGVSVTGSVWIEDGSIFLGGLSLERAHIADSLMLGRGSFSQLDLTATRIDRELRLEGNGSPTIWQFCGDATNPPWLILRNAHVGVICDTTHSWPDCVTLAGFVYDRPPHNYAPDRIGDLRGSPYRWCRQVRTDGELNYNTDLVPSFTDRWPFSLLCHSDTFSPWARRASTDAGEPSEPRSVAWWLNWVERDPDRTGQTYAQLATVLESAGEGDAADAVLFAQRIHERSDASYFSPGFGLSSLEQVLVGFGIGTYSLVAGIWVLLAVVIAANWLLRRLRGLSVQGHTVGDKGFAWCAAASLLTVLPLIPVPKSMDDFLHSPLSPEHPDTQPLFGGLLLFFSGLALLGWVLGGFLLHGFSRLAGL